MYHVTYTPCDKNSGELEPLDTRECDSLTKCIKFLLHVQKNAPECYDKTELRFCISCRDGLIANNLLLQS